MNRGEYTVASISRELDVPYMSMLELKNKLKITKMTKGNYEYLKNTAKEIVDKYERLTLPTINQYLLHKYNLRYNYTA